MAIDAPARAIQARAEYERLGLRIDALFLPTNFNAPRIEEEIEWVARTLQAAEVLQVKAVRIDAAMTGQHVLPRGRRIELYAAACEQALDAAGPCTVPLAIENHGSQGNDPLWLFGVLEALEGRRVGVTLDPANFYWEGHPLQQVYVLVEQLAPYTVHVHCKNLAFPPAKRNATGRMAWQYAEAVKPLAEGDIDQRRVVAALAAAGYRNALTIEEEALALFPTEPCNGLTTRQQVLRRDVELLNELVAEFSG